MSLNLSELAIIYYNKAKPNKYNPKIIQQRENAKMNLLRVKNLDLDLLKQSFEEHIANQKEEFEKFIATKKA